MVKADRPWCENTVILSKLSNLSGLPLSYLQEMRTPEKGKGNFNRPELGEGGFLLICLIVDDGLDDELGVIEVVGVSTLNDNNKLLFSN